MNVVWFILWSFLMTIIFLILFALLKAGLWKFLDKLVPFSFLSERYDGSIHINGLTYQGQAFWLFILSFPLSLPFLLLHEFNFWGNFGAFIGTLIPGIMLLLRIRTFSDNNILPETGLGTIQ